MNKEIALKWADALESGDYKQGSNRLARVKPDGTYYCCLGVLCELAVEAGVCEKDVREVDGITVARYGVRRAEAYLPEEVCEWAGLYSKNPYLGDTQASTLNDDLERTFAEIAARIRKEVEREAHVQAEAGAS